MKKKSETIRSLMKNKARPALTATATKSGLTRSTDEFRTPADLFREDFGIQLNKTEGRWQEGEVCEKNTVTDTGLLDAWDENLYFFCDADGNIQKPQQTTELRLQKPSRSDSQEPACLGPYADVCYYGLDSEGGLWFFLMINPVGNWAYVPLLRDPEVFLFKRVPPEQEYLPQPKQFYVPDPLPEPSAPAYRTIPQIFLEDYGIQLNEASGEWWRLEQNSVVNTELLDNLEHDLYYYITAGGSYGSGDVRLPLKDSITGEAIVPEGWTGPFTDVVWWDCDVEGIVHEFRIYCYAREPYHATQKSVFLTRNMSDPALFATEAGLAAEPEPETAPGPALISEPETEPTADTVPMPAPEPLPVTEPTPAPATPPPPAPTPVPSPPAKTALQEVYETLSPSKLGTVVGLRTLLAKEQRISIKEAKARINSVLKAVSDIAAVSGTSTLYGFGCFKAQNTKARTVKSHLGSYSGTYSIPKTTKFTFKPGKELKAKMSLCTGKTQAQIITALQTLETVKKAKATVRKATTRRTKAKRRP